MIYDLTIYCCGISKFLQTDIDRKHQTNNDDETVATNTILLPCRNPGKAIVIRSIWCQVFFAAVFEGFVGAGQVSVIPAVICETYAVLRRMFDQIWRPATSSCLGARGRRKILPKLGGCALLGISNASGANSKVERRQKIGGGTQYGTRTRTRRSASVSVSKNSTKSKMECHTWVCLDQRWRKDPFKRQTTVR